MGGGLGVAGEEGPYVKHLVSCLLVPFDCFSQVFCFLPFLWACADSKPIP